jgi:hypothetical protein
MASDTTRDTAHKAGAFDVRVFVGALLGLYGIILLITGIVGTSDADRARDGDVNINLWVGIGLIVASAVFILWARMRPVVVPEDVTQGGDEPEGARRNV